MADDLGFEFFKSGKDHLESATKWQIILVAVLLYLHLGIVAPFGEKSAEQKRLDADVATKTIEQAALKPATEKAQAFAGLVKNSAETMANNLRANLIERFHVLSQVVATLQQMPPGEAAGQRGAMAFSPPPLAQQVQQQMQTYTGPILRAMSSQLRENLHAAEGQGQEALLTPDFVAYVRQEVIEPAFVDANFALDNGEFPLIQQSAKDVQDAIAAAKAKAPKLEKELAALSQSVEALLQQVKAFEFLQPADDEWWRSMMGKEDTITEMISGIATAVESTAKSMVTVQDLKNQADLALAAEAAAAQKVAGEIAALKEDTAKVQAQMGELAGPLKLLSFKLESLAPLLCMIVAVALAACALWRAYGLQRMTEAVSLPKWGDQLGNMCSALKTAVGGTAGGLVLRQAAMLAILVGWIWLAFKATEALTPTFLTSDRVVIAALVILAGARAWLWWCSHRALAAGSVKPPEPVAPASLADAAT